MQKFDNSEKAYKKIRTIIVDDHKLMRVGLKALIEKYDDISVVAEAESGKEGAEKALAHKPDVMIIDIGLDDMSGINLAKKIAQELPETKIIILTSRIKEADVLESLRIGVNAYVMKDVKSDALAMIIRTINEGAMWLDPKVVSVVRSSSGGVIPTKSYSRASFKAQHGNLTAREYEVLKLVVDGKSNLEIANELNISEHTSKAHVCNIIQKLVVDDRTQAAVKAIKEGLV
ncbi:two-component system, NarL family, response regulator LiaR [Candidatus Gastranaerophilus sp. (ex Termes propinquus)]|nr:two-component system, NarL family, response regulator LiaR [Candidatus Gastranaerophilus sp. (ex Termes propinquus)]